MNRPLLVIALVYIALIILLRPIIDQPLKPFKDQKVDLVGIVDSEPVFKDRNVSFYLKIISGAGGRIRASVSKFDAAYGDKIGASGKLSYEKGPRNPGLPERAYVSFLSFDVPNVISRGHGNPILRLAFFIRKKLLDSVKKIMPSPYSDLLSGILFGKAAATIPDEIKEQFKKTGTVHILVVSGMHLSILIGVCLTILKSSRLPLWASTLIATLINLLYVLAAGAGASVIRAGIMAEAAMMGQIVDRERDFFTTLSAAALFLLIINPLSLFQIGFQLSFAATISLVYLAPVIRDIIVGVGRGRMPDWFAQLISISIAPMLMTAPIILYNFSQLSLVTVVVNAMIIPWISYLLILGFAAALIGNIFLPLAQILGGTLFLMLRLLHLIVGFFAGLPFACVFFRPPSFILIVAYYVGMGWLIYRLQNGLKLKITKKTILIASLIFLILFVWNAALAPASQLGGKYLEITILDVGQGDAIFVEAPSGLKMLIDGGESFKRSDMGKKVVLPFLHRRGINKLDIVVLTHPHDDHVGGLPSILKDIKVDMVLDSGQVHASRKYIEFLELIKKKRIKYTLARAGQTIDLGPGVKGCVLNPSEPLIEESALNNNSVVIRLVYGNVSFMLTGDMEKEGEERILETFPEISLRSDILKVGHHGSYTASSNEFLAAVNPRFALISCGLKNKFGHPHKSTLDRLELLGIKVYRTDQEGAVVIKTDGKRIFVEAQEKLNK